MIPDLEEEASVVRFVLDRDGVVEVVLERRVDVGMVGGKAVQFCPWVAVGVGVCSSV